MRMASVLRPVCLAVFTPLMAQAPAAGPLAVQGAANVSLVPLRVYLDSGKRSAEVYVINSGTATGHFRLAFSHMDMDENGGLKARPEGQRAMGERFADELLRFSPHEMTLGPGETQVVRLQLRLPADLLDGEYRAHLSAILLPPDESARANARKGEVSVKIRPAYGISIPVIVRKGHVSAASSLSHLRLLPLSDGAQTLAFDLGREGNGSSYGDLEVRFAPKKGKAIDAGELKGVAVYTPNALRHAAIALNAQAKSSGSYQVRFVDPETRATLAEATLEVP